MTPPRGRLRRAYRKPLGPRTWRTRADPFVAVWQEVQNWLAARPERTAKSLFDELCERHPGQSAPGQVWAISPGGPDENPGLYRIDVNVGPGSGVKIINVPPPGPFRESVRYAEGNLTARARELVGDRDPRQHELTVQLRAFDASRSGSFLGLLAFCGAILGKSLKGGLVAVGGLNLGGTLESVHNAVGLAELVLRHAGRDG